MPRKYEVQRGPVAGENRITRWVVEQAEAGGDVRFWLFAGGYVLILFLLCVVFGFGLAFLFEHFGGGVS